MRIFTRCFGLASAVAGMALSVAAFGSEGFYRDLVVKAGVSLSDRTFVPAAQAMGASHEGTLDDNQYEAVAYDGDRNGSLLYPDGQPRYRAVYMNGGYSTYHGRSLGPTGIQNLRKYYYNGGSYTGSCAGAWFVTRNYADYPQLWPGWGRGTKHWHTYDPPYKSGNFAMDLPEDSALLRYNDFGDDLLVDNVFQNGGCFAVIPDDDEKTETLTTYGQDLAHPSVKGTVATWAYKENEKSGRLVVCGGHPESIREGERRDFQEAMFRYAMDGAAVPAVKAQLDNGEEVRMNAEDQRLGDRQYHYYKVELPSGMELLHADVHADEGDVDLFVRQDDRPTRRIGEYAARGSGGKGSRTLRMDHPDAGEYYFGVYGAHRERNGVAYALTVNWR